MKTAAGNSAAVVPGANAAPLMQLWSMPKPYLGSGTLSRIIFLLLKTSPTRSQSSPPSPACGGGI